MSGASAAIPLARVLAGMTRAGEIYDRLENDAVRCHACGHRCLIPEGRVGVCKVRFNERGTLQVPWGYVGALQCDPIEKKPFFHALPGAQALSFGMLGCDYHCAYCQNWITSQAIRDPTAVSEPRPITPAELVAIARRRGAQVIASTYNEPLITSEWAAAILGEARGAGILGAYVSNGNGTERVLDYIQPHVSLYKIDLKAFRDRVYRSLGGTLEAVLRTIESVWRRGIWLEIVTLLVPGFNDSDAELRDMAGFIRDLSPDIPWHVTAFHGDYKMTGPADTDVSILMRAAAIGEREGLRFVYAGNIPGAVGRLEDTRCPGCAATVVARSGFQVRAFRVTRSGACPRCERPIPGVWPGGVRHPAPPDPGRAAAVTAPAPSRG
ncbi:MAG TPA: AmmeMemoRadiSam system radical SAM enzyme [Patescibacteria group bacterium]|nr:AmmeMemoRadiSam system radical SAM enzyme [Patescibacteria group bacterium]